MQTVKLNNEVIMPQLGLGVFQVWDPAVDAAQGEVRGDR